MASWLSEFVSRCLVVQSNLPNHMSNIFSLQSFRHNAFLLSCTRGRPSLIRPFLRSWHTPLLSVADGHHPSAPQLRTIGRWGEVPRFGLRLFMFFRSSVFFFVPFAFTYVGVAKNIGLQ